MPADVLEVLSLAAQAAGPELPAPPVLSTARDILEQVTKARDLVTFLTGLVGLLLLAIGLGAWIYRKDMRERYESLESRVSGLRDALTKHAEGETASLEKLEKLIQGDMRDRQVQVLARLDTLERIAAEQSAATRTTMDRVVGLLADAVRTAKERAGGP